jgi:hypothetical protein
VKSFQRSAYSYQRSAFSYQLSAKARVDHEKSDFENVQVPAAGAQVSAAKRAES